MNITPKPRGNVVRYESGSTIDIISNDTDNPWIGLAIINDGAGDLEFSLNSIKITVKSGETFDDDFEDFNSISIDTAIAYRLALRS